MVDFDPQLIGKVFEGKRRLQVTPEMITAYCGAIGDNNPLHRGIIRANDGEALAAPPGFAGIFRLEDDIFHNLPKFGKRRLATAGSISISFSRFAQAIDRNCH